MKIKSISASNFRGLTSANINKTYDVNVIVGPNAVGKSTLLEAIRLPKTLLAPRFNGEEQQALIQLGALSPHTQALGGHGLDLSALANDHQKDIAIGFKLELESSDITPLNQEVGSLALLMLQTEMAGSTPTTPLAFTQFLSTPEGQTKFTELFQRSAAVISSIGTGYELHISARMNTANRTVVGVDATHQSILTLIDRRLPTSKTMFSMFPADRTFPQGDQMFQLGSQDVQQQLMSHMSSPSSKYARLKQVIIQNTLMSGGGRGLLEAEFNLIFDNLLPGKKLHSVSFNEFGLLKIMVKDERQNKIFDIDYMSSGEKGLILTFLFLRLSMEKGGIVLLDEPELHLNSAVQTKILPFLIDHCVNPLGLQAFVCTHSPEIVRDAYDNERCGLFHLRSGTDITPILKQDVAPLFEVFGRLGSSTSEILFNKGDIYVEGDQDDAIYSAGFADIVGGYKITPLGGRGDIEREIPALQAEERAGRLKKKQLFIMDGDRKPSSYSSTDLVKVHQLKRYCIENYLIDEDILFDLISAHATKFNVSRGAFPAALEALALSQTLNAAVKEVYNDITPDNPGIRQKEIKDKSVAEVAEILAARLEAISGQLSSFNKAAWMADFIAKVDAVRTRINSEWKTAWKEKPSGKVLFDDLYQNYNITMKKSEFKKLVVKAMKDKQTDDWRIINDFISTELK